MFWLDIYGLSDKKEKNIIESFLEEFTQRDKIEERSDDVITIAKNTKYNVDETHFRINTLSEAIDFGVSHGGFSIYIYNFFKSGIQSVILKFTYDDKIIYGISVDENEKSAARSIAERMITHFSVKDVSIEVENPPADDADEFYMNKALWEII